LYLANGGGGAPVNLVSLGHSQFDMLTTIRPEESNDAQAIEQVTIDAFKNAPHTDHTEQFIVRELRLAQALSVSLVAESDGQVVGHVAVSPVQISDGAEQWFGLGPISVSPVHQGKGVGSQLMHAALNQLKAMSASGCVLLGDPNYYQRFGFKPIASLVLPGIPAEYFQAIVFSPTIPQGNVTYHQAFSAKQ
jgi:putative acetyltransferase